MLLLSAASYCFEIDPPVNPVPPYKFIRIKPVVGERVWVLKSDFSGVEIVQAKDGSIVFVGPPGKYAVLGWTEDSQSQALVVIDGKTPEPPGPDPPGPDPPGPDPPGPDPPTPDPSNVLNEFGIGAKAYVAAVKVKRPTEARQLATAYSHAMARVPSHWTPALAEAYVRSEREKLGAAWSAWETEVEAAMEEAIKKHGSGGYRYRDYFKEISAALLEAGK
jgi:hypothetical protein